MRPINRKVLQPSLRTRVFNYTQIGSGFGGCFNTATANKIYWAVNSGQPVSCWMGMIRGSSAQMTVPSQQNYTGCLQVSIDGGPVVTCSAVNNNFKYWLFKNLEDKEHLVVIYPGAGCYYDWFGTNTVELIRVTGSAPNIKVPKTVITSGDFQTNTAQSGYFMTVPTGGIISSPVVPATAPSRNSNYVPATSIFINPTSVATIRFKTNSSYMTVASGGECLFVSIDGAVPTRYDVKTKNMGGTNTTIGSISDNNSVNNNNGQYNYGVRGWRIPLDGQTHTYNVWTSCVQNIGMAFVIGLDSTLQSIGTVKRLDQFGDSITAGIGSTTAGEVETLQVASYFGYAGATYGFSGETIAQLEQRMPSLLTGMTVTSNDVAIITEGRNSNPGSAMSGADQTSYTNIINMLLTKGYGKILCRGVIPEVFPQIGGLAACNNTWSTFNGNINSIVTGLANAKVVYVNPSSWTGWSSINDQTHPNDYGYQQLAGMAITSYTGLL